MNKNITELLDRLIYSQPQHHGTITIVPVVDPQPPVVHYLLLREALKQDLLIVEEVSDSGSVGQVLVTSKADIPILLIDGEELAGAKQNRILNSSFLIPAHSTMRLPVSCSERGRWAYSSRKFDDSDVMMEAKMRARKNIRVTQSLEYSRTHDAGQSEIWEDIDALHMEMGTTSGTSAMKDVYTSKHESWKDYRDTFSLAEEQCGIVVYEAGQPVGFEYLSNPEKYTLLHDKLIASYVMGYGAQYTGKGKHQITPPGEFLARLSDSRESSFRQEGLGTSYRYMGNGLAGNALVFEDEPVWMHVDATTDGGRRTTDEERLTTDD